MLRLTSRNLVPEIMDDPALDRGEHERALRGLRRINQISLAGKTMFERLCEIDVQRASTGDDVEPMRILDLATGAGDLPIAWKQAANRSGRSWHVAGADLSGTAIDHARAAGEAAAVEIEWLQIDALQDALPSGFDVICCSLFLHHLRRDQVISLLREMREAARHRVLISDLRRTSWGFLLARIGTRLLSRSEVVHFDGPQSVRAAWTMPEMHVICEDAGWPVGTYSLEKTWPERFILIGGCDSD